MTAAVAIPDLLGTAPADLIGVDGDERADLDEARKRAERIRAGLASYTRMRQDIADAYARRDWLALDYGSWFEYLEGEFGEELRRLTRDERREAVADLRGQGMSTRQIAAATGVSVGTVHNDLSGVQGLNTSAKVTGADGKSYAASRPQSPARPDPETPRGVPVVATPGGPDQTTSGATEVTAGAVADGSVGGPVTPEPYASLAAEFAGSACRHLDDLMCAECLADIAVQVLRDYLLDELADAERYEEWYRGHAEELDEVDPDMTHAAVVAHYLVDVVLPRRPDATDSAR